MIGKPAQRIAVMPPPPDPEKYGMISGLLGQVVGAQLGRLPPEAGLLAGQDVMVVNVQVLVPTDLLRLPKVLTSDAPVSIWPIAQVNLSIDRRNLAEPTTPPPADPEAMLPPSLAALLDDTPDDP